MLLGDILGVLLATLADPWALTLALTGVALGLVFGTLPGVSSTMALAIMLPVTFAMPVEHAMMFLIGVFSASVYAGSVSAILINIPGTPGAMVTLLDGHAMARQGRAGEALVYALLASTFGGLLGWLFLVSVAPLIARAALHFGSPEYAAVVLFGLTMVAYAAPGATYRALLAGVLGLLCGVVGRDAITDVPRFTFGVTGLQSGIDIVPMAVGIFGLAEVLRNLERGEGGGAQVPHITRILPPWSEIRPLWPMSVRGGLVGALVGAIPAAGSAIGVAIAYAQEKRLSKTPERYGTGIPEGVVAPESANNACVGGALIPMMTLGIPGDSITAVLIGALLLHGLRPGPGLFASQPQFVASVYVALLIAIVLTALLVLTVGIHLFARVLRMPRNALFTGIAVLCVVGAFAVRNSPFDVYVMLFFGGVGWVLGRLGVPVVPLAFGLVLGPLLEENVRRTLIVHGDWWVFLQRPISLVMILVSIVAVVLPMLRSPRMGRADGQ
jgi:putative tricarboxylic transport membrane protein